MRKFKKQGGFTLVEMLIVVAIIAILIAISIPLINNALERAREGTDAANERSFKAELLICYLSETVTGTGDPFSPGTIYAYDAVAGKLVDTSDTGYSAPSAYGKGTANGTDNDPKTSKILYGVVDGDGNVFMEWNTSTPSTLAANGTLTSEKLMSST